MRDAITLSIMITGKSVNASIMLSILRNGFFGDINVNMDMVSIMLTL